jgi:DHA2 family multidrug resistance protein
VPIGVITTIAVMQFVEDPPWEKKKDRKELGLDYVGIGLIALGLGCLQVFLDRGEDDDWFKSGFITTFAILSLIGIVGAIFWLLYAKKPVVDLRVLKDKNFALSSICMVGFASILYGSAVLVPQLAQQQLGYTATLAGLVLSPGAMMIVAIIPIVSKLMPIIQTRFLVAFGFFLMSCALFFTHHLVPNIDFKTLTIMRSSQSIAIAFLFVPITTLAYLTLKPSENADASALFTMFRNVAGSIGISLSTAMIVERTQANMAHMSVHMTTLNPNYNDSIQRLTRTLMDMGQTMQQAMTTATGLMYKQFISQSTILAYLDVFGAVAIFALCFVPVTFFFSPVKASGGGGGH